MVSTWAAVQESGNCNGGSIEVRKGSPTGTLLGNITVTPTDGWGDYSEFKSEVSLGDTIKGVHNIYFVFKTNLTFLGNIRSLVFINNALSAYGTIPAVAFSDKGGWILINGDGSVMEYVENDNWLKFSLDFAGGVKAGVVSAEVAVLESGNCNGGVIEVRRDSLDGDLIGAITVTPTSD